MSWKNWNRMGWGIALGCLAVLVMAGCAHDGKGARPAGGAGPAEEKGRIRIVLVGDSTVTEKAGWGLGFKQFVDERKAECLNVSRGGRSSQSFMREGRWTNALALKGDYYLIQFGHNNEPGKPGRSTDMATYGSNLVQYVEDARALGAKPVLVTPLTRRQWDKKQPGKIKSSLAPYAAAVRRIGAAEGVAVVDLQARSIELCESLGPEKCLEFSPTKAVGGTNTYDGTHLNSKGYVLFARLVVEELRAKVPELAGVLLAQPRATALGPGEEAFDATVAADGSGTFTNLQQAINAAPDNSAGEYRILVRPGLYEGQFLVPKSKRHIHLIGASWTNSVLSYGLNVTETNARTLPGFRGTGVIVLGDDFLAQDLTLQNISGDHGQALALRVDGDRAVFEHCRLLGWQDTVMLNKGRDYLTNCYIEGRVDFIYGSATAVFDHCEIHSKNGGHITAANTPQGQAFGLVFMDCELTGDPKPWSNAQGQAVNAKSEPKADLGRPWRPYASVAYIRCQMGEHIKPEGWNNWGKASNETTARFAEYQSSGPGARPQARFQWARQLSEEEAGAYTVKHILQGDDKWEPRSR